MGPVLWPTREGRGQRHRRQGQRSPGIRALRRYLDQPPRAGLGVSRRRLMAEGGEPMAASSGSSGSGDAEKPTFSFEQLALRVAVAVLGLVLLVTAIELGKGRGRGWGLGSGARPPPA